MLKPLFSSLAIAALALGGGLAACQTTPQSALSMDAAENSPHDLSDRQKEQLRSQRIAIAEALAQFAQPATAEPSSSTARPIILQGKITRIAPLIDRQAYALTDETGTLWVLSPHTDLADTAPNPSDELQVVVQGTLIYQSIPAGEQDWGEVYLQEAQRFILNSEAPSP